MLKSKYVIHEIMIYDQNLTTDCSRKLKNSKFCKHTKESVKKLKIDEKFVKIEKNSVTINFP